MLSMTSGSLADCDTAPPGGDEGGGISRKVAEDTKKETEF